jgi:hypothetical protein
MLFRLVCQNVLGTDCLYIDMLKVNRQEGIKLRKKDSGVITTDFSSSSSQIPQVTDHLSR